MNPGGAAQSQIYQNRFQVLNELARDAMFIMDTDYRFVYANPAALALFNFTEEEIVHTRFDAFCGCPKTREQFERMLGSTGTVKDYALKLRRKRGNLIDARITCTAVRDSTGQIVEYYGIIRDLTLNKRSEDSLKQSEGYTRSIIDSSMDMIIAVDKDRKIIEFNKAAQKTFGFGHHEVIGRPVTILYADQNEGRKVHTKTLKTGQQVLEVLNRRKNGDVFQAYLSSSVLEDSEGQKVGVMGISRDTTEEKQIHEELQRLSIAIEQSVDSIVITDVNGVIQYVNPAFECITGLEKSEVIGQNPGIIKSGHHSDEFYRRMWRQISNGEVWSGQFINRKKNGTLFEEEAIISPVKNDQNKVINYVAIKRDITEKKRLHSIAEAANFMENCGYVFSGIRHEIGNPINSIKMSLTVLEKNLANYSHDKIAEFVQRTLAEVSRVEYLLKMLKNFSLFESPKLQRVHIRTFMGKFLPLIEDDFKEKGIRIKAIPIAKIGWGLVDPRALHQILLNILTNAVDALEEQSNSLIVIRADNDDGWVRIRIDDNGIGMTDEEKQDLFKPFFTNKVHGTGLGLVIVKKMLARMNCNIKIESYRNIGTTVTIIIPEARNGVYENQTHDFNYYFNNLGGKNRDKKDHFLDTLHG